jgi:membrane fusion protein (multidrug efflux system)
MAAIDVPIKLTSMVRTRRLTVRDAGPLIKINQVCFYVLCRRRIGPGTTGCYNGGLPILLIDMGCPVKVVVRIVLIAVVFGGLWFAMQTLATKKQRDLEAFANMPRTLPTVEVGTVTRERWQQYLYSIGSFKAVQDVSVTNEIEGKITGIRFTSGQHVREGEVLVTLDTSVDSAELAALVAEQRLNELQFERSKKLLRDKTVSKSEFDIAAARRDEAVAMTRAKSAGLAKKTIRAPFSGILGIRKVDLGEFLDAGEEIVRLQSISPIYLDFGTPERYVGMVTENLPLEVEVAAYPGEIFVGRLVAVEPGVDRATRNMYMRAEFANQDGRLRPGMFAEIRGVLPEMRDVLTIPETAVTYTPYGNSVFVVENSGDGARTTRRLIVTGEVRNGRIAVESGLEGEDTIVSAGHNKLRNGMLVQVSPSGKLTTSMNAR